MKTKVTIVVCVAALLCMAAPCIAAGEAAAKPSAGPAVITPENVFKIGPGVIMRSSPYRGGDAETMVIPFIMYSNEYLTVKGKELGVNLVRAECFTIKALLSVRNEGYKDDDSHYLEGMDDRRMALDGGVGLTIPNELITTDLSFLTDLTSVYDGQEIRAKFSHPFQNSFGVDKLKLTPFGGLAWRSSNLNDYYYGVQKNEATGSRPHYSAGSGFDPFAGIGLDYEFNEKWSTYCQFNCEWLSSEINDSPIVSESIITTVMVGVLYSF